MEKYMFENREIGGMTWNDLQEATCHGALVCSKVCDVPLAGPVFKLRDPCSDEVCYVYSDEAQQFSNPYRTAEEAAVKSREYSDRL